VLRYRSNAYRALCQTVPEQVKTDALDEIVEWLGERIRQTDSSLLDQCDALTDPESVARASAAMAAVEMPTAAADHGQRAHVHGDGPQRDVSRRCSWHPGTASRGWRSWRPRRPLTDPRGRVTMTAAAWEGEPVIRTASFAPASIAS
jgi:hypothetical protein